MFKRFKRHEERADLAEELGLDHEPMGIDFDESSSGSDDSDSESEVESDAGSGAHLDGPHSDNDDDDDSDAVSDPEPSLGSNTSDALKRKRGHASDVEADSDIGSSADERIREEEDSSDEDGSDGEEEDPSDEDGSDGEEESEEDRVLALPPKSVAETMADPIVAETDAPFKKGYQWRTCIVCPGLKLKEEHVVQEHVRSKRHSKRLAAYTAYAKQELAAEDIAREGENMVDPRHLVAEMDALQRKGAEPPKKKAKVQGDFKNIVNRSTVALAKKGHKFSSEEWAKLSPQDRTAVARVQRMAKRVAKRKTTKSERKQSLKPHQAEGHQSEQSAHSEAVPSKPSNEVAQRERAPRNRNKSGASKPREGELAAAKA